ncbi:MAG: NAD+ synthase [Deltaproteobacteria bacterium CG11_big_fil_rev_8_21_14_0_20_49_13]|nr:MAG: NAD+ synthase [Deltaproteobacteria bacterium CG11_big_fil_rev_8_21_14_0_20_49_13]
MKIAIAQVNSTIGDFGGNTAKMIAAVKKAKAEGAALVVFPEMVTTGYPPRDLLEKPYFVMKNMEAVERVSLECNGIAAILGFVSMNERSTGKGLYNSAAFVEEGKIKFVQHKALLPTYDVFEESRHFEPDMNHKVLSHNGLKIGITICEDVWSTVNIGGRKLYNYDPVETLVKSGAEIIINISQSPFWVGKMQLRESLLTQTATRHATPIIYVNAVGGNDELVFDGRSIVVSGKGEIVHECRAFVEDFHVVDTEKMTPLQIRPRMPEVEELYKALRLGLKDYAAKCHFKSAVVGLSGGIDSCIVAALARDALGAENVLGIAMPSPYSSKESITDAEALAKNLGINFETVPISDIYEAYLKSSVFNSSTYALKHLGTSEENIQARIRGNILMAISNRTGALVLSTGNKSELAVGYCTLYGDMAGGLALISDVPKRSVYELARYINRERELIPNASITKPPSAELRPDQKDTDSLPPYDVLDKILKFYVEEYASAQTIIEKGFDKKIVEDIVKKVDRNEYKRRQAAPGLKVTSKAFGAGRRHPIAWKY